MDAAQTTADRLNSLGNRAYHSSDLATAERYYVAAVEADPLGADGWGNLGLVWHTIGETRDAFNCYQKALALNPNLVPTIVNLGMLTEQMGYRDNAIRLYERALELQPGFARASGNLGAALLKRGEFVAGWRLLDARFTTMPPASVMRHYPIPLWDGSERPQRLFIWPEQGIGDQILYASVLVEISGMAIPFTCEVDPRLVDILNRAAGNSPNRLFIPSGDGKIVGDCDYHIPIMSLAAMLRSDVAMLAKLQPRRFIAASPTRMEEFDAILDPTKTKIAVSWRSFHPDLNKLTADLKSAPLTAFRALVREDRQLVDVQYGDTISERMLSTIPMVHVPIDLTNDIEGVLALIECCDVVVTTSNVTAHFAGALGKSTILVCRHEPALFYWHHTEDGRSLWYPSVKVVSAPSWDEALLFASSMIQ